MGRRVHLHPVVVTIALPFSGKLPGFVGVLLAVPAAAFSVTLADEARTYAKRGSVTLKA